MNKRYELDDTPEAMAANAEHCRKLAAAAQEPGLAGELRRAITAALIPSHELAEQIGVDVETLETFRAGDGELPFAAVDRLVDVLRLTLVPQPE